MIIFVIFYILPMLISFWICNKRYAEDYINLPTMHLYALCSIIPILNVILCVSVIEEYIHERRNK